MNSEETTEEGSVELALENHEELRSRVSDVRPRSTEINSEQTTEERSMEHYCPNSVLQATSYPDADGNIISQVQPDVVTPRGGSNVVRVEPNYGIIGVRVSLGGVQAYIIPVQAAAHLRHSTFGTGSGHINETMSAEASPDFSVRDAVGVELNSDDVRAYIQVAAHFRRSIFGAGSGHINETMSAEASPEFSVRDDVGVELNDDDVQAYIQAQQAAAHFRRSTFGAGSGYITETMSVEASSPGGGDGRLGVEWNDEMLTALRSSAPAMREHDGSQDFLVDEAGGRFLAIHIHPPQQGDQGLVGAARGTQDGPGDLARHALPSVIGGLVPLCFNLLLDDSILKADSSPGYIKAAAAAGLGLVTAFTFLGVASKKRAKAAARVVASASTAAVSIAMVYQVSDNAYIKCVCGIMGCVATLATMAIDW